MARAIDDRDVIAVMIFDDKSSRDVAAHRPAQVQVALDGRRSNAAQIVVCERRGLGFYPIPLVS